MGPGLAESGLAGHEDRCAGEQRARAAGSSRPRPGCWTPATPARRGRPARSPAAVSSRDPVTEGAVVLDVQRPPRRRPPRRTACGRSRSRARSARPRPGRRGSAQRNGWVIEKAKRPPGRSTRAHLAHQRGRVGDERHRAVGGEDHVEGGVGEGQGGRVALDERAAGRSRAGTGGSACRPSRSIPTDRSWPRPARRGWRATGCTGRRRHRPRAPDGPRGRRAGGRRPRAGPRGPRRSPRRRGRRRARRSTPWPPRPTRSGWPRTVSPWAASRRATWEKAADVVAHRGILPCPGRSSRAPTREPVDRL